MTTTPNLPPLLQDAAFTLRWHGNDARYTVSKPNIDTVDVVPLSVALAAYAAGRDAGLDEIHERAASPLVDPGNDYGKGYLAAHENFVSNIRALKSDAKELSRPAPENIRSGYPYTDPDFERLCGEHGIWGTAQSALCAVFWREARRKK